MPLFKGFNALSKVGISQQDIYDALEEIRWSGNLTENAAEHWEELYNRHGKDMNQHYGILKVFLKQLNREYYDKNVLPLLPAPIPQISFEDTFTFRDMFEPKRYTFEVEDEAGNKTIKINTSKVLFDLRRILVYIPKTRGSIYCLKADNDVLGGFTIHVMTNKKELTERFNEILLLRDGKRRITVGTIWNDLLDKSSFIRDAAKFYTKNPKEFSLFRGWAYSPLKDEEEVDMELVNKWRFHIRDIICTRETETGSIDAGNVDERLWREIIYYFAFLLQHPGSITGIIPTITGDQGCGKNYITDHICKLMGDHADPNMSDIDMITDTMNSALSGKHLIVLNEMNSDNNENKKINNKLKSISTQPTVGIRELYQSYRIGENVCNLIAISNDYIPFFIERGDRRYWMLRCNNMHTGDRDYFDDIWGIAEDPRFYTHLLTYLLRIDLEEKDENGRKIFDLRNLTQTSYKSDVTYKSSIEAFIEEKVEQFYITTCSSHTPIRYRKGYADKQIYKDFKEFLLENNLANQNAITFRRNLKQYCIGTEDKKNGDRSIYWVIRDDMTDKYFYDDSKEDSKDEIEEEIESDDE